MRNTGEGPFWIRWQELFRFGREMRRRSPVHQPPCPWHARTPPHPPCPQPQARQPQRRLPPRAATAPPAPRALATCLAPSFSLSFPLLLAHGCLPPPNPFSRHNMKTPPKGGTQPIVSIMAQANEQGEWHANLQRDSLPVARSPVQEPQFI